MVKKLSQLPVANKAILTNEFEINEAGTSKKVTGTQLDDLLGISKIGGSPLIRLIGDEFAVNPESSLYLLEDLTSKIGGGVLTNNNGVTFPIDNDFPLRGFKVASLDGTTQYLSRATEAQFEVGTGSFMLSIWFKTTVKGGVHTLVNYGDEAASEQNWNIRINADVLEGNLDDGTNTALVADPIKERWQDGKWHHAQLLVDKTTDIMYLYVDGQEIKNVSISAVTGTLDNVGTNFVIARLAAATGRFWDGQLANFHLIKAADYNAVQVLNQGIRESVSTGTHTLTADTLKRLNNQFNLGTTLNDYTTTVIDVEEGTYELQTIYEQNTSFGTVDIEIDGEQKDSIVTAGSLADNSLATETGIKLSAGKHILKLKDTSAGQISINWISLIKREGHEQGGATKFLLLGDEIFQRANDADWEFTVSITIPYNNEVTELTDAAFIEGEIFLKGGLYNIDFGFRRNTNRGKVDLDFGDVEILDAFDQNGALGPITISRLVRLNQGKNNIRFAKQSVDANLIGFSHIRGERVSD